MTEDLQEMRSPEPSLIGCTIRHLPTRAQENAAKIATTINPANAPLIGRMAAAAAPSPTRAFLSVLTAKYWGPAPKPFTVSFLEATSEALRSRVLSHMNAWGATTDLSFVETGGAGVVRITRAGRGYWSYLGTDVLSVPEAQPTMCLQGFTMSTPDSEYRRVVRHETGHTLGFPHEHMRAALVARIDPEKAYAYFLRTQGWDRATVDQQVLTPLNENSIFGAPADETSIMCYQLPGAITKDGDPILGGTDINETDYAFAGRLYPRKRVDLHRDDKIAASDDVGDWEEREDISIAAALARFRSL